jgi:hypothetical protein
MMKKQLSPKKMTVFWVVGPCSLVEVHRRFRDAIIALMMKTASTSKTLVNFYQTISCNNPEDSHLHTRRQEKLKSQLSPKLNI